MESVHIEVGDCLAVLAGMGDCSVQCCVTSPPYWGLRDYGTAKWEGGQDGCDHRHQLGGEGAASAKQNTSAGMQTVAYRETCGKCGARRIDAQMGLEATPAEYVEKMVAVFRDVRRVLKDDGTLWLNLGDSYAGGPGGTGNNPSLKSTLTTNNGQGPKEGDKYSATSTGARVIRDHGLKPKDLVGIPWRVAFALQADGWYLRQDIIWAKPNPMPESVTDRCTKSHEYLFLLSKSERYYFEQEAIKEDAAESTNERDSYKRTGNAKETRDGFVNHLDPSQGEYRDCKGKRNKRDVWTIPTAPFKEAHFATFPPDLIRPCILAGSKPGDMILDPFGGSGTTGMVALEYGRSAILIELNPNYAKMCKARCEVTQSFI